MWLKIFKEIKVAIESINQDLEKDVIKKDLIVITKLKNKSLKLKIQFMCKKIV